MVNDERSHLGVSLGEAVSFMLHKIIQFFMNYGEIVSCMLHAIIKFFMNYGEAVSFMLHKIAKFFMNCFYHETIYSFCMSAFASSARRAIASARKASSAEKVVHANIELDSHADSIVAGANCCAMRRAS